MVLETAKAGDADYIVTHDKDLLHEEMVEKALEENIRIVSLAEFLNVLREHGIVVADEIDQQSSGTIHEENFKACLTDSFDALQGLAEEIVACDRAWYSNDADDESEWQIYQQARGGLCDLVRRELRTIDAVLSWTPSDAAERFDEAAAAMGRWIAVRLEAAAQSGELAKRKDDGFFLDDLCLDGTSWHYDQLERIRRGVEAARERGALLASEMSPHWRQARRRRSAAETRPSRRSAKTVRITIPAITASVWNSDSACAIK